MQDYPRTIPATHKVGFTLLEVWVAYSPVKNSPAEAMAKAAAGNPSHSATTGELDIYRANCNVLRHLGAKIEDPEEQTFNGIEVEVRTEPLNRNCFCPPSADSRISPYIASQVHPRIVWSPSFACTTSCAWERQ